MEELFKSLSENVSEACFKDIISITADIINEIKREDVDRVSGDLSREQLRAWVEGTDEDIEKANKRYDKFLTAEIKWKAAKDSGKIKPCKGKEEGDEQK